MSDIVEILRDILLIIVSLYIKQLFDWFYSKEQKYKRFNKWFKKELMRGKTVILKLPSNWKK